MTMEFKCRTLLRPRPQSVTGPPGSLFGREMHRYPSGIAPLLYVSWVALRPAPEAKIRNQLRRHWRGINVALPIKSSPTYAEQLNSEESGQHSV